MRATALLCLTLLLACTDATEQAGLSGNNPVVLITFRETSGDLPIEYLYSLDNHGVLRFNGEIDNSPPVTHLKRLNPRIFSDVALKLGTFRVFPGQKRELAKDSPSWMSDVGYTRVTWTYANGTQSLLILSNRYDDESKRFGRALVATRTLMGVNSWRLGG